jgi:hypothetical protein
LTLDSVTGLEDPTGSVYTSTSRREEGSRTRTSSVEEVPVLGEAFFMQRIRKECIEGKSCLCAERVFVKNTYLHYSFEGHSKFPFLACFPYFEEI